MAFPFQPFDTIDVAAYIPLVGTPYTEVALPNGAGVYDFMGITFLRTVGAAAANLVPVIAEEDPTVANGSIRIVERPTGNVALNANIGVWQPTCPRRFKATLAKIWVAPTPSVYGDTFTFRLRVNRVY